MDKRMDGRTYTQIPPVFYRTSSPFVAEAQKRGKNDEAEKVRKQILLKRVEPALIEGMRLRRKRKEIRKIPLSKKAA